MNVIGIQKKKKRGVSPTKKNLKKKKKKIECSVAQYILEKSYYICILYIYNCGLFSWPKYIICPLNNCLDLNIIRKDSNKPGNWF